MTTATIATKCPEWCRNKEIEDHGEDGHDGPSWPTLRDGRGDYLAVAVGANEKGQIIVSIDSTSPDLTPEQALKAGQYLIEAAQWALSHSVTA